MKRYLIFGAIGPLVGGFLMLFATTVDSGYWTETSWSEISLLYGSRGPNAGALQFVLYGLVGLVPAMLSSWLAHRYADAPQAAHST